MFIVFQAEFLTGFFYDTVQLWVVNMADPWEQVMFYLVI